MALLADIYIKAETLKTLADTVAKKGDKGISITISANDETNDYGQNVTSYVSQSKEDREAKKNKFYVGNGKVYWSNGKVTLAEKKAEAKQAPAQVQDSDNELPF